MPSAQPSPPAPVWAHPLPELVPALREVAAALRRVNRHPEPGPGFRVGFCDAAGHVLAGTLVSSFHQVQILALAMADLGYRDVIAGAGDEMQGCHVLFVPHGEPLSAPRRSPPTP